MKPPAKLSDLTAAIDFESEEFCSFFDRETGQIVTVNRTIISAAEEGDEELLMKFTDSEKEETKTLMLDLYGDFVGMVASARNLPEVRVREIAEGRVWMGTDAMDRGLVDGVGTLPDAVLEAKRLAGLDDDDEILLTEYPKQAPFPRLGLLPNLPGLSLVYRALSEIPANDPKTGEETEDYGTTYFRSLGRSPAQPLLLIPPEMVPEGWDTP